ncbi:oxidoreductase [Aphelenchoides avenae]|nr:oxidoreductase [Aphelenchus avenae]
MGIWRNCVHVSVVSPLLADTDRYGLPLGIASTTVKYFMRSYESAIRGRWFFYGFFYPHGDCLKQLSEFIDDGRVKPIIDKVFTFDEAPKAYAHVAKLTGGGKTVIDYEPKPSFNTPEVPPPGF